VKQLIVLLVWLGLASGAQAKMLAQDTVFGRWRGVCDGLGECAAWGIGETWSKPGYVLVKRSLGHETIRIGANRMGPFEPWVMTVQILGQGGRVVWTRQYRGEWTGRPQSVEVSPEDFPAAYAALQAGSEVRIVYNGANGPASIIKLDGSRLAMAWTRSQAVVRLRRPAIRRARAVDQRKLPEIQPPPTSACTNFGGEPDLFRARLAPRRVLWILTCRAGYNNESELYVTDDSGKRLRTPVITQFGEASVSGLGQQNLTYDPQTRTLASTVWGRQMGGCGERAEWVWDGAAFQFSRFSSFDECHAVDAPYWPVRYRVPVVDR
jgi:hypothetical protein